MVHKTRGGIECDSGFECSIVQGLEDDGVQFEYEPSPLLYRTKVRSAECADCGGAEAFQRRSYTPDLRLADGSYVEIKGNLKPQNRHFLTAVLKCNPTIKLRFVFQRDNKYGKGKRYSDWATSLGCEFGVGYLPKAWSDARENSEAQRCNVASSIPPPPTSVPSAKAPGTIKRAGRKSDKIKKLKDITPRHKAAVALGVKASGD